LILLIILWLLLLNLLLISLLNRLLILLSTILNFLGLYYCKKFVYMKRQCHYPLRNGFGMVTEILLRFFIHTGKVWNLFPHINHIKVYSYKLTFMVYWGMKKGFYYSGDGAIKYPQNQYDILIGNLGVLFLVNLKYKVFIIIQVILNHFLRLVIKLFRIKSYYSCQSLEFYFFFYIK
jgi:hypothetical protein